LNVLEYDIHDFIQVERIEPEDSAWSVPSPFDLRFKSTPLSAGQRAALSGTGIYMISLGRQVAYLGKYQPANGDIIADRWSRHLQTITARGYDIGLGGRSAEARLSVLLAGVGNPDLRQVLLEVFRHDRGRFRDTGYNTSPNRLRFASDNWDFFGSAAPRQLLDEISFTLLPLQTANPDSEARAAVTAIERLVLQQTRPCCNRGYRHRMEEPTRSGPGLDELVDSVCRAARDSARTEMARMVKLTRR